MNDNLNFRNLESFCRYFSIHIETFNNIRRDKEKLIRPIHIVKSGGGYRIVHYIKDDAYRSFISLLNRELSDIYIAPACVHGFVKNKSAYTNALVHTGQKRVLNIDIKNFFQTISKKDVVDVLVKLGLRKLHATFLSDLLTTKEGQLATGFSTSPTIANVFCEGLDSDFCDLSKKYNCNYTRYADDITFSGEAVPALEEIVNIIKNNGFRVNYKKYRLQKKGGPQYVTGFTVCDEKPRIPRRTKKNLRLETYYMKKYGFFSHFIYHCKKTSKNTPKTFFLFKSMPEQYIYPGWVGYLKIAEPEFAKKIKKIFSSIRLVTEQDTLVKKKQ